MCSRNLLRRDLDKFEKLAAVIQILRQIITPGTVIKWLALALLPPPTRTCRSAGRTFSADLHGISSGIGGLFNSRLWGRPCFSLPFYAR